jgi:hypothetical protein
LKATGTTGQLRVQLWSVSQRATEDERSPLPRYATSKCLVKTLKRIAIVESCYLVKTSESRLRRLNVDL